MPHKKALPKEDHERNTEIALFRYGLIASLLFAPLLTGQVERLLRQIASPRYVIPYSKRTLVGISTPIRPGPTRGWIAPGIGGWSISTPGVRPPVSLRNGTGARKPGTERHYRP